MIRQTPWHKREILNKLKCYIMSPVIESPYLFHFDQRHEHGHWVVAGDSSVRLSKLSSTQVNCDCVKDQWSDMQFSFTKYVKMYKLRVKEFKSQCSQNVSKSAKISGNLANMSEAITLYTGAGS